MTDFHPQKIDNPLLLYEDGFSREKKLKGLTEFGLTIEPIVTPSKILCFYPISDLRVWVIASNTVFLIARDEVGSHVFSVRASNDLSDEDGVVVAHTRPETLHGVTLYIFTDKGRIFRLTLKDDMRSIERSLIYELPVVNYSSDLFCITSLEDIVFFTFGSGIIFCGRILDPDSRVTFRELPIHIPPNRAIRSLQAIRYRDHDCTLLVLAQDLAGPKDTCRVNLYRTEYVKDHPNWRELSLIQSFYWHDDVVVIRTLAEKYFAIISKSKFFVFDGVVVRQYETNRREIAGVNARAIGFENTQSGDVFTFWLQLPSGRLIYGRSGNGNYRQYSKCSPKFPTEESEMSLYMEKLDDTTFLKLSPERKLIVVSMSKKGFPYSYEVLPFSETDASHPNGTNAPHTCGYATCSQIPFSSVVTSYGPQLIQRSEIFSPAIKPHVIECSHSIIPPSCFITNIWDTHECMLYLLDANTEYQPKREPSSCCQKLLFEFPGRSDIKLWTPTGTFEYGSFHGDSSGEPLFKGVVPNMCTMQGSFILEAFDNGFVSITLAHEGDHSEVTDLETRYSGFHSFSEVSNFHISALVMDPDEIFLLITEDDGLRLYQNGKLISSLKEYTPLSSLSSSLSDLLIIPLRLSGSLEICMVLFDDYGNVQLYDKEFSLRLNIRSTEGTRFRPVAFRNFSDFLMIYNQHKTYLISLDDHQIHEVKLPSPPYLIKHLGTDTSSSHEFFLLDVNYRAYIFQLRGPYSTNAKQLRRRTIPSGFIPLASSVIWGTPFQLILGLSQGDPTRFFLSVFDSVAMDKVATLLLKNCMYVFSSKKEEIRAMMTHIGGYNDCFNRGLFAVHICGHRRGIIFVVGLSINSSQNPPTTDASQFTLKQSDPIASSCVPSFMTAADGKIALVGDMFEIFELSSVAGSRYNLQLTKLHSGGNELDLDGFLFQTSLTLGRGPQDWKYIPGIWRKRTQELTAIQFSRLNGEGHNIVRAFAFKRLSLPVEMCGGYTSKLTGKLSGLPEIYSLRPNVRMVLCYAVLDISNRVSFYSHPYGEEYKPGSAPFHQVRFSDVVTDVRVVREDSQDIEIIYDSKSGPMGGSMPLFVVFTRHNTYLVSYSLKDGIGDKIFCDEHPSSQRNVDNDFDVQIINV